jgi:UDP-glucose 4-epimerase
MARAWGTSPARITSNPRVLQVALGPREAIAIFGSDYPTPDGTCIRDYVHTYDLAVAHMLVLKALDSRSEVIYNLGNGQGLIVRQIIESAQKITGRAIPVQISPRRPGDPAILIASSEKIRSELLWKPCYPTIDSIIRGA